MILADESMNGPDKVVPAMKRIDNERYIRVPFAFVSNARFLRKFSLV